MEDINLINAVWIPIEQIEENKGQIDGVPANPRKVSPKKFNLLKKSIQEDSEMLGLREILVVKIAPEKYVAIGGNMRLKAMRKLEFKQCPCKVLPEGMSAEKLAAIAAKDNGHVGTWDIDPESGWDLDILKDWGANIKVEDQESEEQGEIEFSEVLNEEHNILILYFDNEVDWLQAQTLFDIHPVLNGSTRNDGVITPKMRRIGTGRVLRGAEALNKIMDNKK